MRVWVTRTRPQGDRTAERLTALGHDPVLAPVLAVEPILGGEADLSGIAAIAFTSQNGVQAFTALEPVRDLPVFTTGEGTAAAAREAGFAHVEAAEGDGVSLAALIARLRPPGPVLWVSPQEPARDLGALLSASGIDVRRAVLYRTVETGAPPPQGIAGVLVHSPRAAQAIAAVLGADQASRLSLFAISAAAAEPLARLPFAHVAVAPRPDESALLGLLPA